MNERLSLFLTEDLKLRHSKRSKKFKATINGLDETYDNIDALVGGIESHLYIYKNNTHWQLYKSDLNNSLKKDEDFQEKLHNELKEHVMAILSSKADTINKLQKGIKSQDFETYSKELGKLPKDGMNVVDKLILSKFRYCKDDRSIYIKDHGQLKLIDKFENLKKDPTKGGICKIVQKEIGDNWNQGTPLTISKFLNECLEKITNMRFFILKEIGDRARTGEKFDDMVITYGGFTFSPKGRCRYDDVNAAENAVDSFCLESLWSIVPCSIFTSKLVVLKARYNIYYHNSNDGVEKEFEFCEYSYDVVRSGEALTEAFYLKNVFNVYASYIIDEDDFRLDNVPRTYADDNSPALFTYNAELLKNNFKDIKPYTKLEDCKNLMLLKSWMNEDEFRFAMAWAYGAVRPCTVKSNISLLLWTGGGTGKSSFVAMIKYAIMMFSGAEENDVYFEIKGHKFDEDTRNWQPDGEIGLAKAALINVDEATTTSIELYKDFSGSADKNRLNLRQNYENAITYDVKGKFIFTTNKGLQLTSDDGSLQRRVAVIKHQSISNIVGGESKTNEEIVLEYKKQIPMMLKIGKECLKEIEQLGYKTIDEYAMKRPEISKNLKESMGTSVNVEVYEYIWNRLENEFKNAQNKDGSFRIQGGALKKFYEDWTKVAGEDMKYYKAFINFILDKSELFVKENVKKAGKGFLRYNSDHENIELAEKVCNSLYFLHALKNPTKYVDEDECPDNIEDL